MANTIPDGIYYPENTTVMELDTILATMASSIQNGIGKRVAKLETFVGCNLGLSSAVPGTGSIVRVSGFNPGSGGGAQFNQGMIVNNGVVTVPEAGLYNIMFTANFIPTNTTASRLNTYIYVNGSQTSYSSATGEAQTNKYTNCNITAVYNLKKNDQVDVRIAVYDGASSLTQGGGSSFCISLVSRALS